MTMAVATVLEDCCDNGIGGLLWQHYWRIAVTTPKTGAVKKVCLHGKQSNNTYSSNLYC